MRARSLPGLITVGLLAAMGPGQGAQNDQYLAGYVTALLEHRFELRDVAFRVEDGVLYLDPEALPPERREAILLQLGAVEGLRLQPVGPPPEIVPAPALEPPAPAKPPAEQRAEPLLTTGFLPAQPVFAELIADPRWPRFSASLLSYQDDEEFGIVGAANLGAVLPIYGFEALGGPWQIGIQAGVFSIFDLEAESLDLINADYFVALPLSARYDQFSAQVRLFHQSSHLGDEYILRAIPERINLSYEGLDLLLSLDLFDSVRVYGGGGGLFHTDPDDLEEWRAQGGIELSSPGPVLTDQLFPLAALDVQAAEETGWDPDYSVRAGLELRNELLAGRRLQLMLEYFNGNSPNGQFFERKIEYVGTGIHFYF
jgi:hypothetical protein